MGALHTIGRKLKSAFVVGLIFFSGVVVGGIISGAAVMKDITTKAFASGPAPVRKLLVQHAKDGLGLDEDQQYLFWQIITETGGELSAATKPVQPQINEIMARSELRLRAVLTPEQTPRFDRWAKQARERWGAAMSGLPASSEQDSK